VKSFVIESEIPQINAIATNYARRLLGQGAFVRISPTKKLKTTDDTREELLVEAGIPGCAQSYSGASKGQRHRLDLALILAFRSVVAARSACPFDQLFADELFDGVDATGVDCVVEILQEISAQCPVVLVTHDARLKSVGDRRVVVAHDGKCATLR
jgi:DNA repair exonuclease SbcCD ATPase subunit